MLKVSCASASDRPSAAFTAGITGMKIWTASGPINEIDASASVNSGPVDGGPDRLVDSALFAAALINGDSAGGKAVFSIFRIHTGSVRLRNCMKKRAADTTAAAAAGMQLASGETRRMPQQARRGMLPALRVLQALAQHHEPPHSPWTGRFAQTGTARLKIAAQRQARACSHG